MNLLVHNDSHYKSIAFDFDGVLSFTSLVFPKVQCLSQIHVFLCKFLSKKGWIIVLNTARNTKETLMLAEDALVSESCPFSVQDSIGKAIACLYVDDRSVGGLPSILSILKDCSRYDKEDYYEGFVKYLQDQWLS